MNTYIQDKLKEFDDRFAIIVDEKIDGKVYLNRDYGDFYGQRDELKDFIKEMFTDYHNHIVESLRKKVVLYVASYPTHSELSHEDRLKIGAEEVIIYLGDTTDGVWGDDWNDAPDECNSGTPYADTVKGLEKIVVKLGHPLLQNTNPKE